MGSSTTAWKRTYAVVWFANLTTAVGMMSFLPFFPAYLRELGVEGEAAVLVWTGLVAGAAPLTAAFASPLWGAVGDRVGRKLMVVRAMVAIAVFVGSMGLVQGPWQLLGLRLLQGLFSGFIPPSITLVSVGAPEERQGRVAGTLQAALAIGQVVGPLLGGEITRHVGMRSVFGVVAALAAFSALLVVLFAREDASHRQTAQGARFSVAELLRGTARDLAELRGNPRLRSAVVLLFWIQFGMSATNPLLMLFVEDLWEGDPERVPALTASMFTLLALTNIVAMPLWGRAGDRAGHSVALQRAAWMSAGGLLVHALVPTWLLLWPARVLLGAGSAGAGPTTFGVAAAETPPHRRGGAFGAVFSSRALAVALSSVLGGVLATVVGIRGLFVLNAVVVAVFVVALRRGGRVSTPSACGQVGDGS